MKDIKEISEAIKNQDNRATAEPIFLVQALERIGPIVQGHCEDGFYYFDPEDNEAYYFDSSCDHYQTFQKMDDRGELPDRIVKAGYVERWITIQACFTEKGCKHYLAENRHNLRQYHGIRIYVDSLFRNSEMIAIRQFLKDY